MTTEKIFNKVEEAKLDFKINIEKLKGKDNSFFVEKIGSEYVVMTNSEKQKNEHSNENKEIENNNNSSNVDIPRRRSLHLSPHFFEVKDSNNNHNHDQNTSNNGNNWLNEKIKNNEYIKEEQVIRQSELLWKSLLSKQPLIGKEILLELIKDYSSIAKIFQDNIIEKDFMYAVTPREKPTEAQNNTDNTENTENNDNNDNNCNDNNNKNKNDNTENKNDVEESTGTMENFNKKDIDQMGKWLSFWLSSIISRANEPYFIYSQLNKLEQIGINESNFSDFIEIINQQYNKHNNNSNNNQNEQLQSLNDVLSRIQTLLIPPQCYKCHQRMQRQIPKDIKPCHIPNVYGVCLSKMSRSDQIPFCKSCQKSLENSDLAFVCLNCGAYGVIRIIRNGKLKGMLMTKGNSLCLECVYNGKLVNHEDSSENDA